MSYFVVDIRIHPILQERGYLADVSITDISKDDLFKPPLIVRLKQQRNKQVVREDSSLQIPIATMMTKKKHAKLI